MEVEVDEKDLKATGAEMLTDGWHGLHIHGWEIESSKRSILNSLNLQQWEEKLQTSHLPEFSGLKIQPSRASRSMVAAGRSSRVGRCVGGVVCEAQEIAVEVSAVTDATWQSIVLDADTPF